MGDFDDRYPEGGSRLVFGQRAEPGTDMRALDLLACPKGRHGASRLSSDRHGG